jgi:hypothetical protein
MVVDEQLATNSLPLDLTFDEGVLEVREADELASDLAVVSTSIATFSQIYLGFISASEASEVGLLSAPDEALELLDEAFAGPSPILLDGF